MSTPGPERVPSTVKVDKTSGQGKPPEAKPAAAKQAAAKQTGAKAGNRPGGARPQGKGGKGGKGRKPVAPVKVSGGRNWGPIAVAGVVVLFAVGIIGYGVYASVSGPQSWEERAAAIQGIVNYRENSDKTLTSNQHVAGKQTYKTSPPVGGNHNSRWQNCQGMVYDAPIPNEHAVHSLEHGAVWITYKPGLPADQISKLAEKVTGKDFMMMSPYASLDKNISLQAWGYQLKVDNADDARIDEFIKALRVQATLEPLAGCASNQTATGDAVNDSPGA